MKQLPYYIVLFLFFSCNQSSDKNIQQQQEISPSTPLNIKKEVNVNLMPQAAEGIAQWVQYNEVERNFMELENYNLNELKANIETIIENLTELQSSLPKNFNAPAVQARINVLVTKVLVLDQQLKLPKTDLNRINNLGSEISSEFEYFKLQLNELFLQSPSDFPINPDNDIQPRDSVFVEAEPLLAPLSISDENYSTEN